MNAPNRSTANRRRPRGLALAGTLVAVACIAACSKPSQEAATAAATAPAASAGAAYPKGQYAALETLPDWGGVWVGNGPTTPGQPRRKGKYLEAHEAQVKARAEGRVVPNPFSNCLPRGMPTMMAMTVYPLEFLFTPGRVTVLLETWMQWRVIHTDGRPHPEDLDPSFMGDSIGHWEGDTLVVDTVGIKQDTVLPGGVSRLEAHGPNLRVVERIRLDPADPDTLIDEMTLIDPDALEEPFTQTLTFKRSREMYLMEFICAENDRNPVNESGESEYTFK